MRKLLRPVAFVAAGLITATMIPSPAGAAAVDDGASWLTRQLTDNVVVGEYRDTFTDPDNPTWVEYTDQGLTADVAIALDTIGGRPVKVTRIGEALAPEIDAWTGAGDYANSVAKAAVTATITGQEPTSYGGIDLVAQLEARTADAAPIAGRLEDGGGGTDYANTIGQAFAALALDLAGSPEADAARAFLLDQQCADGSFRLGFSAKDAVDQSCDADPASVPDTDATALSVILLSEVATADPAVDSAITSAVSWLKATQRKSGAFGGGTSTEAANTNSTGLAAWALGDQGSCARAEKAADWVRTLQVRGSVKGTPLAGEKGAIAYDKAAYRVAKDTGIKRAARDQWRRASVQAAPGLRFVAGC